MNDAERIEQVCADAWPAQVEQALGEWRLRAAGGFTGRANSALALGDPGVPLPEALREVCDFAHDHGIRPMMQTVKGGLVEDALARAGCRPYTEYANGHEVSVLLGPISPATGGGKTEVRDTPTPGWWELAVGRPEPAGAERHVLTAGSVVGFGAVELDGVTVGGVRGSVAGDLLLVARLAVRPGHRRRGLATDLMAAIGDWGRRHGATRCALQVAVGNTGALALYVGLGFTEHHRYRYWIPRHPVLSV